jgi:O-antigen/teichoic acid export membrane protein
MNGMLVSVGWDRRVRGFFEWIRRHRHINWVFADQAMVSGCNFLTGILLARYLGPEKFGIFVLLYSVLLYANTVQAALILSPMLSVAPQYPPPRRHAYLNSIFTLQIALSIFVVACVITLGFTYARFQGFPALEKNLFALSAAVVAFQLQDWLRRYYFVEERERSAFFNDALSYGGQVVILIMLSRRDLLDVGTSFWAIAGTSTAAVALGLITERIKPVLRDAGKSLRTGWKTGRDYLIAGQLQWLGSQGVLLVGGSDLGPQVVGGIRATQNIVGPINILFLVMENVVSVRAARLFASGGRRSLIAYLKKVTLLGTVTLAPILAVIAFFGAELMRLLYGEAYSNFAALVVWQVAYIFLSFFYRQAMFYHRSVQQTRPIAWSGAVFAFGVITVALIAIREFSVIGIMLALVAGQVMGLSYLLFTAFRDVKSAGKMRDPARAASDSPEHQSGDRQEVRMENE